MFDLVDRIPARDPYPVNEREIEQRTVLPTTHGLFPGIAIVRNQVGNGQHWLEILQVE